MDPESVQSLPFVISPKFSVLPFCAEKEMNVLLKDVLNTKLSHCQTPKRWFLTIAKTSSITNDYEVFCMILGFIMEVHLSHFPWAIKMMIDDCVVYYFQFISQVKILIQNEDGQRNECFLPSDRTYSEWNIWIPIKFIESCYMLCWSFNTHYSGNSKQVVSSWNWSA